MSRVRCGTHANISVHEKTIDETDVCCKTQALCYGNVSVLNSSSIEETKYRSIFHNDNASMRESCLYDRQAASCLQQALTTFHLEMKTIDVPVVCGWESQ